MMGHRDRFENTDWIRCVYFPRSRPWRAGTRRWIKRAMNRAARRSVKLALSAGEP